MGKSNKVKRWIKPVVQSMSAYHAPPAEGLVKLDAMENPYNWPEDIKQAWLTELASAEINRYPDAEAEALKEQISSVFSIPQEAQLLLGNGSDEIIQILTLGVAQPGTVIMAPEPSFAMYRMTAQIAGAEFVGVPLKQDDFSLDVDAMLAAIKQYQPAIIFLAWPNNPTGNLFDETAIISVIEAAPGIVVLDEAYHVFAQKSFMPLLEKYENLLVMRTLSKLGLAGLRLGFIAGCPAWLNEFEKLRMPYNIGVLTQRSVAFILQHMDVLNRQASLILSERDELYKELTNFEGIKVWPSDANFLLFKSENSSADIIHLALKERGIMIKNLSTAHPYLQNCLRIAIGTQEENENLLSALKETI